jgi:hypothetical protein
MFLVFQALTFALGSLMIRFGATYASLVNGILLSMLRTGFFPFSLIFSVIYGLVIDGLFQAFGVKKENCLRSSRLIASMVAGTAITGLSSMYFSTLAGLMPMVPILYLAILVVGVLNGIAAGYLTLLVWNKYLASYSRGIQLRPFDQKRQQGVEKRPTGVTAARAKAKTALLLASFFGGFQMLMPAIGWLAGTSLKTVIMGIDHWIAFGLLTFIGSKMIYDSMKKEDGEKEESLRLHSLMTLAVATSIDALMVGLSYAFLQTQILASISARANCDRSVV